MGRDLVPGRGALGFWWFELLLMSLHVEPDVFLRVGVEYVLKFPSDSSSSFKKVYHLAMLTTKYQFMLKLWHVSCPVDTLTGLRLPPRSTWAGMGAAF